MISPTKQHVPYGYVFKAFKCDTAGELEEKLNTHKETAGFYPYFFPHGQATMLVIALENPEAVKFREQATKQVIQAHRLLTAAEATEQLCKYCDQSKAEPELLDGEAFIVYLYDHGFVLTKKTDQEVKTE